MASCFTRCPWSGAPGRPSTDTSGLAVARPPAAGICGSAPGLEETADLETNAWASAAPRSRSLQAACDSAHPRLQLLFAEWPLHRHSAHGVCTWTKPAFLRRVLLWAAKDEKSKGEGCVVDADAGEFRRDAVQGGPVIPVDLVPTAKGHIFALKLLRNQVLKLKGASVSLEGGNCAEWPPHALWPRACSSVLLGGGPV